MLRETARVHLDLASWKALRENPTAHGELMAHLAEGCETCDLFLATHVDEFDGVVDKTLLALSGEREAPLDEVGWRKLRRRLSANTAPTRRWAMGAGLAAAITLTVGALYWAPHGPGPRKTWDGLKGAAGPNLEVAAALRKGDNAFVRLDDGAHLTKSAVLVFQADSSLEGPARIYLQRGSSTPVEIGETALSSGKHEIRTDTGLLGVSLEGERGDLSVWIVVGESPFSNEAAIHAIEARGTSELATARVKVNVE